MLPWSNCFGELLRSFRLHYYDWDRGMAHFSAVRYNVRQQEGTPQPKSRTCPTEPASCVLGTSFKFPVASHKARFA
jgi:hypothetical protein